MNCILKYFKLVVLYQNSSFRLKMKIKKKTVFKEVFFLIFKKIIFKGK